MELNVTLAVLDDFEQKEWNEKFEKQGVKSCI